MKKIEEYATKRFRNLKNALVSFQQQGDPEQLHTLRVEVKRIKALLKLMGFSDKHFKAHRHFIPFRHIFREAGALRQTDVFYELLLRYEIAGADPEKASLPDYEKAVADFQQNIDGHLDTVKKERKRMKEGLRHITKKQVRSYLRNARKKLKSALTSALDLETLHKTRKTIKEIIYLTPFTGKEPAPFYHETEQLIGNWNDKRLLINMLVSSDRQDEAQPLQADCDKDVRVLRKKAEQFFSR